MAKYKKIMVGLDLTPMDSILVKYASMAAEIFGAVKIYFVNVRYPYAVLPLVYEPDFPLNLERKEKSYLTKMKNTAEIGFKNTKVKFEFVLKEGQVMNELLKFSHERKIDLIITGRKEKYTGSGMVPKKLARKANCDVLLIPEKAKTSIKNILVPTDFSEHSALALKEALLIAGNTNAKVIVQSVFYAPVYPVTVGHSQMVFSGKVKEYQEKEMRNFVKKNYNRKGPVETVFTMDDMDNMSTQITHHAVKNKADLVIMGSRGKSNTAAILLGSVTEKVIKKLKTVPILVVKKKNENFGLLKLWFS